MGQAESTTLTKRAAVTTAKIASQCDEKIEDDEEEYPSYFSATMMMHVDNTEKEPLTPITSFTESGDTPGEGVHNAFYCVEKGHTFSIKCSLLRPPPPGISFGARVYVDSGATNLGAYARAGTDNEDDLVDTAEFDHYFWFGPGETSYTVKGFYRDSGTSYPFTFVSPKKGGSDADTNKHFGAVRIQFAKVTKWLKRQEQSCPESASKKKRRIAGGDDSKGVHVAAYPASSHTEDDVDKVEMDAVLSPQVLFESRLFYNDFAGYRKQATVGSALLDPTAFRGLPFSALAQADVRRRCLDTFLRAFQRGNLMIETEVRLVAISTQNEDPAPLSRDNAPIPLNAIVDAISKTLSPAASFLVCVGSLKEGNYGEGQYVQSFTTTKTLLADDREKMSKSLLDFFSTRPDLYDLQADFGDTRDKENAFTQSLSSEEERHFKKTLLGSWFPTTIRNHENKIRKTVKQQVAPASYAVSFASIVIID